MRRTKRDINVIINVNLPAKVDEALFVRLIKQAIKRKQVAPHRIMLFLWDANLGRTLRKETGAKFIIGIPDIVPHFYIGSAGSQLSRDMINKRITRHIFDLAVSDEPLPY